MLLVFLKMQVKETLCKRSLRTVREAITSINSESFSSWAVTAKVKMHLNLTKYTYTWSEAGWIFPLMISATKEEWWQYVLNSSYMQQWVAARVEIITKSTQNNDMIAAQPPPTHLQHVALWHHEILHSDRNTGIQICITMVPQKQKPCKYENANLIPSGQQAQHPTVVYTYLWRFEFLSTTSTCTAQHLPGRAHELLQLLRM